MRTKVATIGSYIAPSYNIYPWWSISRITQLGFVVTYYWNIFMKTSMMDMANIGRQTCAQLVTLHGRVFTFGDFNAATRNGDDISSYPFFISRHFG